MAEDNNDALAKVREIAARLSGGASSSSVEGEVGSKRKNRFEDEQGNGPNISGAGLGLSTKKKIFIPQKENPDVNFLGKYIYNITYNIIYLI